MSTHTPRELYRARADVQFGVGDSPPSSLPANFQGCVKQSASGASTAYCDGVVGSKATGLGYCSTHAYEDSSYCACVNAPVPSPECIFGPCAEYPNAYKTTQMQEVLKHPDARCSTSVNCAEVQVMGGSANVAPGVTYPSDCNSFRYWIIENLTPIVFVLILLTIVAVLVGYDYLPRRRRASALAGQKKAGPGGSPA